MFHFLKSSFNSVLDFTFRRNRKRKAEDIMSVSDGLPEVKKPATVEKSGSQSEQPVIDLTEDEISFVQQSDLNSSSFVKRTFYTDNNTSYRMRPMIRSSRRRSNASRLSNESNGRGTHVTRRLYSSWCDNDRISSNDAADNGDIEILSRHFSSSRRPTSRRSMSHSNQSLAERLLPETSRTDIRSTHLPRYSSTSHVGLKKDRLPLWKKTPEKSETLNDSRIHKSFNGHSIERNGSSETADDDILVTRVEIGQKLCEPKSADFEKLISQCQFVETDWLTASKNRSRNIVEENFRKADALKALVKECEAKRSVWDSYLSKRTLRYLRLTSHEPTPIPDIYLEPEISDEEEELPPFTKEMRMRVESAFHNRRDAVLCDNFRLQVTVAELATLRPRQWLSDMVINFYMQLIAERNSKKEGAPSCHPMTTFFYPKLRQDGYSSVRRWTRRIDIFGFDFILVPVHLGMHWCFALIQVKEKKISYFDSMQSPNNECLTHLLQYLIEEMKDKKGESLDINSWSVENAKNIPVQRNGYDCGVFTCQFAEFLSRKSPLSFSQEDMGYFRERMMYEILTMKLLT